MRLKIFRKKVALVLALVLCALQFFSIAASAEDMTAEKETAETNTAETEQAQTDGVETEMSGSTDTEKKLQAETEDGSEENSSQPSEADRSSEVSSAEDSASASTALRTSGGSSNPNHGIGEVHTITDFVLNKIYTDAGTPIRDFSMTIDGIYRGYCAEFDSTTGPLHTSMPTRDAFTFEDKSEKSVLIRKVMYYGAAGPGAVIEDDEKGRVYTALGVSYAYSGLDCKSGIGRAFVGRVSGLPEPPEGFDVYVLADGTTQDTAYAVYNPKHNLSLVKETVLPELTEGNSCYSLEGAVYKVYSDEKLTEEAGELVTDQNGKSDVLSLKPGTYYVKEVTAPAGCRLDGTVYTAVLAQEDVTLNVKDEPYFYNGGLMIQKIDAETGSLPADDAFSLAGAQFLVTWYAARGDGWQNADSRSWLIETQEEDGVYKASLDKGHLVSGDEFFMENGQVCLPEGTLTIEETKAPAGYTLENAVIKADTAEENGSRIVTEISESGGSCVIAAGNTYIASDIPVHISTAAHAADSDLQEISRSDEMKVVDTVKYTGLTAGEEYTLKARLMNTDGEEAATGEMTFTPEKAEGTVDVELTVRDGEFDKLTVFEELYNADQEMIARHTDADDEEQTVHFPKIGTRASCGDNGDKEAEVSAQCKVHDTVSYTGLIKGKTYCLTGRLMDAETGRELEVNGKPVTAETEFTAEDESGTVQVDFVFDSSSCAGRKLVVFEKLYTGDTEIAVHEDLTSEEQSFSVAEIPGQPAAGNMVKTGDTSRAGLWLFLCLVGGAAVSMILLIRKASR